MNHMTIMFDIGLQSLALAAIRAGGWFPEWLGGVLSRIRTGTDPMPCYPTPLEILSSLRESVLQHECNMEIAEAVVRTRPDLPPLPIYPLPYESASTREPPASPETTTRPTLTLRPFLSVQHEFR